MNRIFNKIRSKEGSTDMVVILITLVIFAAVSTFYVRVIMGNQSDSSGIEGASSRVTEVILHNVP